MKYRENGIFDEKVILLVIRKEKKGKVISGQSQSTVGRKSHNPELFFFFFFPFPIF